MFQLLLSETSPVLEGTRGSGVRGWDPGLQVPVHWAMWWVGNWLEYWNHDPERQTYSLEWLELDVRAKLRETPITHKWPEVRWSCPSGSLKRFPVHPVWWQESGRKNLPGQWVQRKWIKQQALEETHSACLNSVPVHPDRYSGRATSKFHVISPMASGQ